MLEIALCTACRLRRKPLPSWCRWSGISGAGSNVLIIDHFQNVAKGHFTVRRQTITFTPEFARAQYEAINIFG